MRKSVFVLCWSLICLLVASSASLAQAGKATRPAPGPITIAVDATEAPRHILHAQLTVPVSAGHETFYYPKWIPGEHGPTGPIDELAGLRFTANGQALKWERDLVDMYTFHVEVPQGVTSLQINLDYLVPTITQGFSEGASASDKLAVISWNQVLLYPAGYPAKELTYKASLKLPQGWKFGTALPVASQTGETIEFQPVPLNMLVDSPVQAGEHFRTIELATSPVPHYLHMVSDDEAALQMPEWEIADYKQLVAEEQALFGAHHYNDYHFLYTLSDYTTHMGLEHHQSSDDRVAERTAINPDAFKVEAGLLPHEFTHSWNGKYRRPADLATPDYQTPMRTDLLWVYEGLTQYISVVLSPRSGLLTPEQARDDLALTAAYLDHWPGRSWRNLQDTANAAQVLYESPEEWRSWRRTVDFYDESTLIWLDVDTTIRQLTNDKKSIDDFCHVFHGPPSTGPITKPYTFNDVVAALNEVVPHDWANFLRTRLDTHGPGAPLNGITDGGWKLMYTDVMSPMQRAEEETRKMVDVSYSLGFILNDEGRMVDVIPGTPAAKAGLAPDMKLIAVNGRKWSREDNEVLRPAVRAAKGTNAPIQLLVENDGYYRTYNVDYHDGEKYPHLVRDETKPDYLDEIFKPHAPRVEQATGQPQD